MGYILPIQQHEYADYQRRMVTRKRTVSSVKKSYRAILQSTYEELRSEEEKRSQQNHIPSTKEEQAILSYPNMDRVYSDITGIGQFFNEKL
ncbi:hypothetical protein [Ornithinibacillus bavariensis]|uniref:Uncharacterized protein n=1 Tax=Ornithinibacillus bavariensis TaxID=545502 RepID=A0A920C6K7_9BACI|nr:hypothetical protein [Ornithinibacillus bavariensis]GIO25782.1 hypothetical protein J43TS3_03930 [Ornithinibacillus bavariensis]HAM79812.1 hypothetical protein [Ornithinibacillus sp.]